MLVMNRWAVESMIPKFWSQFVSWTIWTNFWAQIVERTTLQMGIWFWDAKKKVATQSETWSEFSTPKIPGIRVEEAMREEHAAQITSQVPNYASQPKDVPAEAKPTVFFNTTPSPSTLGLSYRWGSVSLCGVSDKVQVVPLGFCRSTSPGEASKVH